MLERGTLERDFALSMEALGFGDEPMSYRQRLLRPDTGRILCRKHQKKLVRGSDRAFATRLIFRDVRAVPIPQITP